MEIRSCIDPETGHPHIENHDLTEDEVEDVMRRPGEDRPGANGSRIALDQTRAGRYLRVVYVPEPKPDSVFVITAYEPTDKPLKTTCAALHYRKDSGGGDPFSDGLRTGVWFEFPGAFPALRAGLAAPVGDTVPGTSRHAPHRGSPTPAQRFVVLSGVSVMIRRN